MDLTEIHIKLADSHERNDRIRAYVTVVVGAELVVRDLKIVETQGGRLLVCMPNRELRSACPTCHVKVGVRARYCPWCGSELPADRGWTDPKGRTNHFTDVCHPINAAVRADFDGQVIEAYELELEASRLPGYDPRRDRGTYEWTAS